LFGSHLAYLALTLPIARLRAKHWNVPMSSATTRHRGSSRSWRKTPVCGEIDVAAVERWLKKATTLDYVVAAQHLMAFYGPNGLHPDPGQQYLYTRLAAGYWEAINPNDTDTATRAGFGRPALARWKRRCPSPIASAPKPKPHRSSRRC
jgi:hypothetical protein